MQQPEVRPTSPYAGHTVAVDGGLLSQQRSPQVDIFPLDQYPDVGPLSLEG
jgi:hypothetical protein